jgi:hypothetical protein
MFQQSSLNKIKYLLNNVSEGLFCHGLEAGVKHVDSLDNRSRQALTFEIVDWKLI